MEKWSIWWYNIVLREKFCMMRNKAKVNEVHLARMRGKYEYKNYSSC